MNTTPFLMWYDGNPKTTINVKIADALARFSDRFGVAANVALVPTDSIPQPVDGIDIRIVSTINKHTVWVGREI